MLNFFNASLDSAMDEIAVDFVRARMPLPAPATCAAGGASSTPEDGPPSTAAEGESRFAKQGEGTRKWKQRTEGDQEGGAQAVRKGERGEGQGLKNVGIKLKNVGHLRVLPGPYGAKGEDAGVGAERDVVRMITSRANRRDLHMRAPPDTPAHTVTLPAKFGSLCLGQQAAALVLLFVCLWLLSVTSNKCELTPAKHSHSPTRPPHTHTYPTYTPSTCFVPFGAQEHRKQMDTYVEFLSR